MKEWYMDWINFFVFLTSAVFYPGNLGLILLALFFSIAVYEYYKANNIIEVLVISDLIMTVAVGSITGYVYNEFGVIYSIISVIILLILQSRILRKI